jgi:hypothetical protein
MVPRKCMLVFVLLVMMSRTAFAQIGRPAALTAFDRSAGHWRCGGNLHGSLPAAPVKLVTATATETSAPDASVAEPSRKAEDAPPAANEPPAAVPRVPTERLPAGSPVSFPVDI